MGISLPKKIGPVHFFAYSHKSRYLSRLDTCGTVRSIPNINMALENAQGFQQLRQGESSRQPCILSKTREITAYFPATRMPVTVKPAAHGANAVNIQDYPAKTPQDILNRACSKEGANCVELLQSSLARISKQPFNYQQMASWTVSFLPTINIATFRSGQRMVCYPLRAITSPSMPFSEPKIFSGS